MVWSSVTVFYSVTNFGQIRPSSGLIFFPSTRPPPHGATARSGPGLSHYRGFTNTLRRTALGRTPLDEWSARRRDFYLYNTHNRQTSSRPTGFEPAIPASERAQTNTLDGAATGTGSGYKYGIRNYVKVWSYDVFWWAATGFSIFFYYKMSNSIGRW